MDITPEIKAEFDRLGKNFGRIDELETQIKSLAEKGEGVAELKAEVNKLANDNAAAVKALGDAQTKRQDDFEAEAMKRLARGTAAEAQTAGQIFVESDAFKSAPDRTRMGEGVVVERKAITTGTNLNPPNFTGEIVRPQDVTLTMRDLIPGGRSQRDVINYARQTVRAANAAVVLPAGAKPESNLDLPDATATMVKLAHYIAVTEEQLSDIDGLQSLIDAELEYGLLLLEDTKFLNGPGGANEIHGIIPQATAYVPATYGTTVALAQRLDHIRGMIAQLQVANFMPDGMVLNPLDWFKIETTKTTEGAYLFANPQGVATPNLWGLPVAVTTQIAADTGLVGSFRSGAQIFDGQLQGQYGIVMKTGQPGDFFLTNRYAVLAEERVTLAVKRPTAFVTGDLTPA